MKTTIVTATLFVVAATLIVCAPKNPTPAAAPSGTYCVDVGADATRVETAYGSILGLKDASGSPRPATTAEIEAATFDWIEGSTHDFERRKDMATFIPPPFQGAARYHKATPSPTPTATQKK